MGDNAKIRRISRCSVPGHGTRCEVARERADTYPRSTERRMALAYERVAGGGMESHPRDTLAGEPGHGTRFTGVKPPDHVLPV